MNNTRRNLLLGLGAALVMAPLQKTMALSQLFNISADTLGNFKYIYGNKAYSNEFYAFLTEVFHLYPEDLLHQAIITLNKETASDEALYLQLQPILADIKPFFGDVTYALPALNKQKKMIASQTVQLIDNKKHYQGYLEIGSTGRYVDSLEEVLNIDGERFFLSENAASYSPVDIIDRGQLNKAGKDLSLQNYQVQLNQHITAKSIDLVTVYIGFHHCPIELREQYISAIRDVMTDDASLILRDHNAHNEKMTRMVALAHDVFNMGTDETWWYNHNELRHFYSLDDLEIMMNQYGFKSDGRKLYQQGDPTLNALMVFKKS